MVFVLIVLILCVAAYLFLNSGSKTPDNTVWESYIGRDTTVGILPDAYANYFTYTLVRTSDNIGFKIKGKFPNARYFSFNVYSLGDNATQGSLVDYQIQTDSGRPNPFLATEGMEADDNFTVYLVPKKYNTIDHPNTLQFTDDTRLMTMVIRLYDYNIDDFGGVEFPTVEAISLKHETDGEVDFASRRLPRNLNLRSIVRRRSLPKMVERLSLLYETEKKVDLEKEVLDSEVTPVPFHAIDASGFIENNDNKYLLAGISKAEDEVYYFKFKAPSFTTGPKDINQTDVRYWSFNLGNSATYNFNALKDEDAIIDTSGYVHLVLASKDENIEKHISDLGFNFLEWNMPWKEALILFRHMLADPNFGAQITSVPPIKNGMSDFAKTEAHLFMGDYAPQGWRMTKEEFNFRFPLK